MGTVHYRYWHSMVPVPVLAFLHFGPVPVWVWYITQYGHGTIPVLALNGACTEIGICEFWSSTSIGMVHYQYWH
jgi:hypothetical protein